MKKLNVALVGLGFGGCFLPIYLDHPMVETVGVFDTDPAVVAQAKEDYPEIHVYDSFEAILADPAVEALIRARNDAKKAKNFAEADSIRDELKAQGVEIIDIPHGAKYKKN